MSCGDMSAAVYRWLRNTEYPGFVQQVQDGREEPTQAVYCAYGQSGDERCIHTVSPDIAQEGHARLSLIAHLTATYKATMRELKVAKATRSVP